METMSLDSVGRETGRAWLDTVIPEVLRVLRSEHAHVLRTEAGWRFKPPRSEYYAPLRRQLSDAAATNLEQVTDLVAVTNSVVSNHDSAVQTLVSACDTTSLALVKCKAFQSFVNELRQQDATQNPGAWDSYFGAYREESDRLLLLAGHIINRTSFAESGAKASELPGNFTVARIWNPNRDRFIEFLRDPSVNGQTESLVDAFTKLEERIEQSIRTFADLRVSISRKHDLPYAATPAA